MSAFLGPIHYWLYNKIQLQEQLIGEILQLGEAKGISDEKLRAEGYEKYGEPVTAPLETVIDGGNIHGWLQACIASAEYRLAYTLTQLLNKEETLLEAIKEIFYHSGKQTFSALNKTLTPQEAYKEIFDALLEGMPCDRVNEVMADEEDHMIWQTTSCIHEKYWEAVAGDINLFYSLRKAWINGFLSLTDMTYESNGQKINKIRRGK